MSADRLAQVDMVFPQGTVEVVVPATSLAEAHSQVVDLMVAGIMPSTYASESGKVTAAFVVEGETVTFIATWR